MFLSLWKTMDFLLCHSSRLYSLLFVNKGFYAIIFLKICSGLLQVGFKNSIIHSINFKYRFTIKNNSFIPMFQYPSLNFYESQFAAVKHLLLQSNEASLNKWSTKEKNNQWKNTSKHYQMHQVLNTGTTEPLYIM